jgi:hypothetical protein
MRSIGETSMQIRNQLFTLAITLAVIASSTANAAEDSVKEVALDGTNDVKIKVRMEGPYTADTPLQIVCYFKYTPEGVARMRGAPVELDKELGGVIASLRSRGEFTGEALETILLTPPTNSIKAKRLLLIGLGDESTLSLDRMEQVGRVALREAARVGARDVAFAPLIKDAGNSTIPAGDVETAVIRGMLLAYDTEKRLQAQGIANDYTLASWEVEAGPAYFDETVAGVKKAITQSADAQTKRDTAPYAAMKK